MTLNTLIHRPWLAAILAVVGTSLGLSGSSVSADEAPLSPALKAVQGVWVSSADAEIQAEWTIKSDQVTATVNGVDYVGKLILDTNARPHAAWTIELQEGPDDAKGKTARGVYKLDGEKLVVNIAVPGRDRPTGFDPVADETYLFELKKEKKG